MRVEGPNRIGAGAQPVRRTQTGSGFHLPEAEAQVPAQRPAAAMPAPGLDALLALQSVDVKGERRRKAVGRGRQMLDLLDSLKLGMLDGTLSPATLENLRTAVAAHEPSEDPQLDAILAEIELRAEVELAKLKRDAG